LGRAPIRPGTRATKAVCNKGLYTAAACAVEIAREEPHPARNAAEEFKMANVDVCLTFDFDAMSLWVGTFRAKSPSAISRGEFGKVGAERLLGMLADWGIKSTWFVPGHTADAFPHIVEKIAADGHEIGHHGYFHERQPTADDERRDFDRAIDALRRVTGKTPVGYRSPAADLSPGTLALLLDHGFLYDSSQMGQDFTPYYCRIGDQAPADGPFVFGREAGIVELPFTWGLDDFPAFEHVWTRNVVNPGLASPSQIYEIWSGDFDYLYERLGEGVYTLTMHPQVIGRGHRLLMLERLIDYIRQRGRVAFKTMAEVAREFKKTHPLG
jgi:peptidoglycan-N-acetylglucosamine deacetylase